MSSRTVIVAHQFMTWHTTRFHIDKKMYLVTVRGSDRYPTQLFPHTHLSERFKDPSKHVLCDVEVQRAHVEPHGAGAPLLQVVGHGCSPVLLCLQEWKQ